MLVPAPPESMREDAWDPSGVAGMVALPSFISPTTALT